MLVELKGVGGGGAGDVCSLGGLRSGVANLTLFTLGSSSAFPRSHSHLGSGPQAHDIPKYAICAVIR